MATVHGLDGSVTMPSGMSLEATEWSMDYTVVTDDTSGFESGGFKDTVAVQAFATGTVTGLVEGGTDTPLPAALADGSVMATNDLDNASGTLTLTAETGNTFAFDAVLTSMSITRPHAGAARVTYSFESNGPITQTWA